MNKRELVASVAEISGNSKALSATVVDAVFASIRNSLIAGEKVGISGFGSFTVAKRNARVCRNLQTGETIDVPAKMVPKFTASSSLKEVVSDNVAVTEDTDE